MAINNENDEKFAVQREIAMFINTNYTTEIGGDYGHKNW